MPPLVISMTIRPTSMTVTATARISDPKGSPTRCATTSAWWTAASTAPTSRTPISTSAARCSWLAHVAAKTTIARTGTATVHWNLPRTAVELIPRL